MLTISRVLLTLGVLLVLCVGAISDAAAHAALLRSDPPAGAVLPAAPTTIRLWFSEPLEPRFTRAQVLDAAGAPVAGASSAIAPEDDHQLVVNLPADLPDGGYTVAWRNLSAADGHTLEGYFGFSVGAGAVPGAVPAMAASPGNDTARAITRALALIGLTALLAIAPVTLGVLDPTARFIPGLAERLAPRLRRYGLAAAGAALLGSVAALVAQAVAIVPDVALPAAVGETLTGTRYGQLLLMRVLGLLLVTGAVLAGLWGRPGWRRPALVIATVIGLGVPLPFSLLSHAAAQPHGAAAAVAADALHLLAAAVWGGGVLLLAAVLAPALYPVAGSWREALRIAIPRFSVLGLTAWGILWLSGLYSAWLQVGSLEAVTDTPYGQSLLLKGTLLLPILALAALHLVLGWRGASGDRPHRLAITFALEGVLVIAVLLVVGRLIGQEPARAVLAAHTPTHIQVPLVFPTDEGERTGQVRIAPGAAGTNTFTLEVAGSPLPEDAEGVLRFALPAQNIGQQELRLPQVEPNRFAAEGSELALGGDWQLTVVVRAIGAFAWSTDVNVAIGATPPPPPAVNPAPVFDPPGIAGMLAAASGVAALAAALVSRGVPTPRRGGLAGVGLVAVAAGLVILSGTRTAIAEPQEVLALSAPVRTSPASTSPHAMTGHHHMMATPEVSGSVPLPGLGTPASEGRLVVTLDADTRQSGPTDLTLTATDEAGEPVSAARVVVFAEMMGMGGDAQGVTAVEETPGRYRAQDVPLSMVGPWQVTVRIAPKGQPTSVVRFAVEVGERGEPGL